jgi:O-succinylbenzoic acid--CoA ligase
MKAPPANRLLLLNQDPKAKSVIMANVTFNFEELTKNVLSTASVLLEKGISKNDPVGIYGPDSPDYLIIVLSLWQIGGIPVPLNTRLSKEELLEQINAAKCKHVLISKEFDFNSDVSWIRIIEFPSLEKNLKRVNQKTEIDLDATAVIIFTSGSGKSPKGVKLSFNSLYQSGFSSNRLLRYSHSDRWLLSLPLYHIGGFSILVRSILWGIPIIFPHSFSPDDIAIELKNSQPTFISLVAAQLKKLIDKKIPPNPELKNCLIGGGFSDNKLVKKAIDLGYPINIVYGSTETSSFVTALLTEEFNVKRNSAGRALPPTNIFIYDEDGIEIKPYEVGEIAIKTSSLMNGYINQKEFEENFRNGVYFSGDIGYLDEEGYLFIVGRKNHLISTGGENVNPIEVESALLQHQEISEAIVFPLKDHKWGEMVAAAVVLKSKSGKVTYDELKFFLEERISKFKVPKKIFFEKELPKTELGKVERNKLIKNYIL